MIQLPLNRRRRHQPVERRRLLSGDPHAAIVLVDLLIHPAADQLPHRQRFLAEQGYGYIIKDADDLLGPAI